MNERWLLLAVFLSVAANAAAASAARPAGMAGAFSAVADDPNAMSANPAGLTRVARVSVLAQRSDILNGLTNNSNVISNAVSVVAPIGATNAVGAHYHDIVADRLSRGQTLHLSYARKMSALSAGVSLKRVSRKYISNPTTENALDANGNATGRADPLFADHGFAKSALSADVGAIYAIGKNSLALSLADVNRPDLSLDGSGDRLPLVQTFGFAKRFDKGLLSLEARRAKRLPGSVDSEFAVGGEYDLRLAQTRLTPRAGYARGSRGFENACAGLSFGVAGVRLDYAFELPLGELADADGNHSFAILFTFGDAAPAKPVKKELAVFEIDPAFAEARNYYLSRKSEGAGVSERLALLQYLYLTFSPKTADATWIANELQSLGQ